LHSTQGLCQYRLYRLDHAHITYFMLQRQLTPPSVLVITSRHELHREHRSSIVEFVSVAAGTRLPIRYPETVAARIIGNSVLLLMRACILRALPSSSAVYRVLLSNESIRYNIVHLLQSEKCNY
jgi:hypothetical protein